MKLQPAWIVLCVSLVAIAGRSLMVAQATSKHGSLTMDAIGARSVDPMLEKARSADSLLAVLTAPERNPFSAPVARYQSSPVKLKEEPQKVVPPRVVLLMQDGQSTMVQIEVAGQSSGRMTVGSRFQGWTIDAITAGGIAVTNGKDRFVLPRP